MVRYYCVEGDTKTGGDFEYIFRSKEAAEKKFDSITDVPYKVLQACGDEPDVTLKVGGTGWDWEERA